MWSDGYSAMSPAAVQQRAKAGQGSMYHHFSGKADLAGAALDCTIARLSARAQADLAGPGDPIERVCSYLAREREPLRGCPVGRLTHDRKLLEDESLHARIRGFFADLESWVAAVLAEPESALRTEEAEQLAITVVAVLQGAYVLARADGDRDPYDRAMGGLIMLLRSHQRTVSTGTPS
jgi:TetR/AcrR family transcriptional repressor of nem operon